MQDSLQQLDSFESLRSHVSALETHSLNSPFVNMESISFRGLFTEIYNTVNLGKHGAGHASVELPSPDQFALVRKMGYNHFKVLPIPVAPGFNGNLVNFIKLSEELITAFSKLPEELKLLRLFIGNVLNGADSLDNLNGNPTLDKVTGVDPKSATEVKGFFKANLVREALAGHTYKSIQEWDDSYTALARTLALYKRLDLVKITDLSKGFRYLLRDLKTSVESGELRKNLSSKAIAQLASKVERVAVGVSLTSVLGSTLVEIANAKSQEVAKLLPDPLN